MLLPKIKSPTKHATFWYGQFSSETQSKLLFCDFLSNKSVNTAVIAFPVILKEDCKTILRYWNADYLKRVVLQTFQIKIIV